ncbi:hypothetical protein SY83_21180 [Paenibacillus swuensis]|uniref:Uncharacterized protein n=1 Tax=Paenibacillus swuensis TaxID=1178515 RepID=A0A172TNP9_9BACL|nr:hypothetical protein [Paenibacillus swuensis]ANE48373.1 hypothetical protein SY83_21180 [Paenibacillus swuensis]
MTKSTEHHTDKKAEQKQVEQAGSRDNPEQNPSDNPSLHDLWEEEKHVDPIPLEDLKLEQQEEKDHTGTKHRSSSERKYHTGFED